MRIIINLFQNQTFDQTLGQMKGILSDTELEVTGNVTTIWDIGPVLNYIKHRLPLTDRTFALLEDIVAVMNNRGKLEDLEKYDEWHGQEAIKPN